MKRKRSLHRSVIERFTERAHEEPTEPIEEDGSQARHHFKRFLKTVSVRKQQILERILMDED